MTDTLANAKALLRDKWEGGVSCPCCGQLVKRYRRKLNSNMAYGLIRLVRAYILSPRYYHITELGDTTRGGDFAKLRHFTLIEEQPNDDSEKRTSGYWMPTTLGFGFAGNRCTASKRT